MNNCESLGRIHFDGVLFIDKSWNGLIVNRTGIFLITGVFD